MRAGQAAAGAAGRGADSVLGALAGMRGLRTLLINNREGEIENPAQFQMASYIVAANPSIRTVGFVRYAPPPPPPPLPNAPKVSDDDCGVQLQVMLTSQLVADLYRFTPGTARERGRWDFVSGADVEDLWANAGED
ncbi:hypothetical protein AURDEDRAFT_131026 [Auricularia subglabra TFB-10046 SS5]|uniref:Uncharacterized protein n=1 Tax=Auricularia subglabra (strain TFB-10046 / SS5) TaxID=717982 RepID=J0CW12_AURST|nr:hypothetical protein AURDEDRAFT_131026 [Auricularia subglabra TFB-10046 SS5]